MKRILLAVLATFVVWQITDFLIHGILLMDMYAQTAELWRPMEEMNRPLMMVVSLVSAIGFSSIYGLFFKEKNLQKGLLYGIIWGITTGASMGFGTYAFQAIPMGLAMGWFLGSLVQMILAGAIVGWIVKA